MLRILAIEPYYGGSHKAFLDGYRAHSRHQVELLAMAPHKWKWRMRGAALHLAGLLEGREADVILASDYLDLAALAGLRPWHLGHVPLAAYFHENQLTYPLPEGQERDYHYGFTNITTCLAADRVIFNSRYHLDSFLEAAAGLLRRMPDCVPEGLAERIRERSLVIPVGVDLEGIDSLRAEAAPRGGPLRILWNHRWEFDKCPEAFFEAVGRLEEAGCQFELAVVGQSFRTYPPAFDQARRRFAQRLRAFGYLEDRRDYLRLLLESDVVVSTAIHEFFGVAILEAIYAGCMPLLPRRLSYPELMPPHLHSAHLYRTPDELFDRLRRWAESPEEARSMDLRAAAAEFGWDRIAPRLDAALEELAEGEQPGAPPYGGALPRGGSDA